MNTLQGYHVSLKEHDTPYTESSLYINAYSKAEVEDYLTQPMDLSNKSPFSVIILVASGKRYWI